MTNNIKMEFEIHYNKKAYNIIVKGIALLYFPLEIYVQYYEE